MTPARCPKNFAPGSGLPRKQPVRGATLCKWRAFFVGAATRGEWRRLGAGSFAPRAGLPRKQPVRGATPDKSSPYMALLSTGRALFSVGGATRGERRQLGARKASPRGRASHKSSPYMALRCAGHALFCGSRDPRRMVPARCPKSFAPGSGLPQIEPVHGAALYRPPAFFLWEARPAANGASSVPEKLRPGVGPPTKATRAWRHLMQVARFSVGAATRGERRQLGAGKASPRRRTCYSKSIKNTRVRRVISARA